MYAYEKEILTQIIRLLKERFAEKIVAVYAIGLRVRGDFYDWSDFDLLLILKNKNPKTEKEIISVLVDEEVKYGISFTPVIKDIKAFALEQKFHTPFYENVMKEGMSL
ncbi:MAG: nucleotidyltransferase domain-containing protein [bacterium]